MTTPKLITPPRAAQANDPRTRLEEIEDAGAVAEEAAGEALRAVEVAGVVLLGLLVCPPLAILVVLVVIPLLATVLVLGLLVAVVSTPYLLVHHFRAPDRNHGSLFLHRLRRAGRAVLDLLPHRIVADARKGHPGR